MDIESGTGDRRDPRSILTFHLDVDCPHIRYYCVTAFVPFVGISYFVSAWAGQNKLGHEHLQHKYWAPALIGTGLMYWSVYFYLVCACWQSLSANATMFIGCPVYFTYIWMVLFVTFVPDYDWLTLSTQFMTNLSLMFDIISMLSESMIQIGCLILVFVYRDKISKALGIESAGLVRAGWRDIADPEFRTREYIAVKIAIFKLSGYIPASDEGSMSNDLFVRLQMGTNETCNSRVHNRTPSRRGMQATVVFNEVLQMNLPKDPYSKEELAIGLMDQDVVENEEIATRVIKVSEIYKRWLTPGSQLYTGDKEIVSSPKGIFFLDANGTKMPPERSPVWQLDMTFIDDGHAKLGMAVLPADQRALEYIHPTSGFAAVSQDLQTFMGTFNSS
jgi:hypothetical protein